MIRPNPKSALSEGGLPSVAASLRGNGDLPSLGWLAGGEALTGLSSGPDLFISTCPQSYLHDTHLHRLSIRIPAKRHDRDAIDSIRPIIATKNRLFPALFPWKPSSAPQHRAHGPLPRGITGPWVMACVKLATLRAALLPNGQGLNSSRSRGDKLSAFQLGDAASFLEYLCRIAAAIILEDSAQCNKYCSRS